MVVLASDKRWLVTLYALNKIVAPDLKDVVKQGMNDLYLSLDGHLNGLATPCTLKTLTFAVVNSPGTAASHSIFLKDLNFENINSNFDIHGKKIGAYNYNVNNFVDVAKLYLPNYLAVFSAFDKSMDVAAALKLLGCKKYPVEIFSSSNPFVDIRSLADDVRANVRNRGDHFKEGEWTETFFHECFDKLSTLVKCLPLPAARKDDLLVQLSEWKTEGFKEIVDEDFKDLLENFQNGELEAINEKLDRIPTRDERDRMMETITDRFDAMENLIHTILDQQRDLFRNGTDIETSVRGSSVSPTNAALTEGCETRDEKNGVTCHVSESSAREELENPSAAVEEEPPENQGPLEANDSPQITPNQVDLKLPMPPFCIVLKENLKEDSGKARFKELGEVKLQKVGDKEFFGRALPESPREGLFKVTIESQNGDFLGETEIMYVDIVEQVLKNVVTYQEKMPVFIRAALPHLNANSGRGCCDSPNSIGAGPSGEQKASLSVQLLLRLLYKAAEVNAKWFIHLIFNLPAGRIAFDSYKETSLLPEDVATSYGHEEIAEYLREVKKRFSMNEDGREGQSNHIDWKKIIHAIEAAQTEINIYDQTNKMDRDEISVVQDNTVDEPVKTHPEERLEGTRKDTSIMEEEASDSAQEIVQDHAVNVDEDLFGMSQQTITQGAGTTTIPESKEDENLYTICNPITEKAKDKNLDLECKHTAENAKLSRRVLHKAAINGRCDIIEILLECGEDVNQTDKFGLTPLHLAAWYGQKAVVKLLLQHGANVNSVDRFQKTALQKAERNNHQHIVELLLRNGVRTTRKQPKSLRSLSREAFLHVEGRSGFNRLQAAVLHGDFHTIFEAHFLLGNFVQDMNFQKTGSQAKAFPGRTADEILLALQEKGEGNAKIEKLYREIVEKTNTLTELHLCKDSNDAEKAVEIVLNEGVDINIPAKSNRTPLLWASLSSSGEFIQTLIDLGADVNAQRTDDKVTPLSLAAWCNNYTATDILLRHGANVNTQHFRGWTPLHCAASEGSLNISQLLIDSGCDIDFRNNSQQTPLYLAINNKHEHVIKLLLESKANVNIKYEEKASERIYLVRGNDKGKLAWHYVLVKKALLPLFLRRTAGGNLDVADFGQILKSGWGKDPPDSVRVEIAEKGDTFRGIHGLTVLHLASKYSHPEIVERLVKQNGDLNGCDGDGFTPLHLAAIHGNVHVVKKLVELNADVNLKVDGKDAADLAHMNEETEIEEFLKANRSKCRKDSENQSTDSQPLEIQSVCKAVRKTGAEQGLRLVGQGLKRYGSESLSQWLVDLKTGVNLNVFGKDAADSAHFKEDTESEEFLYTRRGRPQKSLESQWAENQSGESSWSLKGGRRAAEQGLRFIEQGLKSSRITLINLPRRL